MVISSANTPCLSDQKSRDLNSIFHYDIVMAAFSDNVKPLFPEMRGDKTNNPMSAVTDEVQPLFIGGK